MIPNSDQVNTLVVDVDGVLTDGAIHVHENGTQSVRFCVKDGLGLVRWRESQWRTYCFPRTRFVT